MIFILGSGLYAILYDPARPAEIRPGPPEIALIKIIEMFDIEIFFRLGNFMKGYRQADKER